MSYTFNPKFGFGRPVSWTENGVTKSFSGSDKLLKWIYSQRVDSGGDLRPDWKERVFNELCDKRPSLKGCVKSNEDSVRRITLSDVRRFYVSMRTWAALDKSFVSSVEAERRATICASCPNNVAITGCFGCQNALPAVLEMIKGRKTSHDASLNGCSVCGCALKAKVHLPEKVMTDSALDSDHYPDHCWIKSLLP